MGMKAKLDIFLFIILSVSATVFGNDCVNRGDYDEFKANLLRRIAKLESDNTFQAEQIATQQNSITILKELVEGNQESVSLETPEQIPHFNSTSTDQNKVRSQDDRMTQVSRKRLSPKISRKSLSPDSVIAFYAYLSATEQSPGAHHIIVYDYVVTNSGNGYSNYTGVFTAPVAGFYVFSWTTFAAPHSYFSTELIVNSIPEGNVFVEGAGTSNGVTGIVVLHLRQSDVAMVRSKPGYAPRGNIRSNEYMRTSFTGWCISC